MPMSLTPRDVAMLEGVHPDLVGIVARAADLSPVPFRVFEGARTVERQRTYVRRGVSRTMNSRHIAGANGVCHAVDLVLAFDVDGDGDIDVLHALNTRSFSTGPTTGPLPARRRAPMRGGGWRRR